MSDPKIPDVLGGLVMSDDEERVYTDNRPEHIGPTEYETSLRKAADDTRADVKSA
jgi:hypothetical protein